MKHVHRRTGRRLHLGCVIILLLLLVSCGKSEELKYETFGKPEQLAGLQGKTVALLAFEYDARLMLSREALSLDTVNLAQDYHKEALLNEFGKLFTVIDLTGDEIIQPVSTEALSSPESIQAALLNVGAEGGMLVKSAYGYLTTSVTDAETTHPYLYVLVSTIYLVDSNGDIVWSFYGKAADVPNITDRPLAEIADSVVDGALGREPDEQDALDFVSPIIDQYVPYNLWLISADIEQVEKKNYFVDYPGREEESEVAVFPALEESRSPQVPNDPLAPVQPPSRIEEAAVEGAEWYAVIWDEAKDSTWREWGQWDAAKSSVKLMVVSLIVMVVCSKILSSSIGEDFFPQLIGFIGLIAIVGLVVSVWYLLRAVF